MLKRTTGLSLLTLLVITGLAGTIDDNSLSKKERKYAVGLMKDTRDAVADETRGLSENQLNYKASPEKWSVKECVYHIAAAEKLLWSMFETNMKTAANPEKRAEIKITDEDLVKFIEDRESRKFNAPDVIQPANTGFKNFEEAINDFRENRLAHIRYMKTSTEDLRNHVTQLPGGMYVDSYQFYIFIAAHSRRHTRQLIEVKNSPNFPTR